MGEVDFVTGGVIDQAGELFDRAPTTAKEEGQTILLDAAEGRTLEGALSDR